MNETVRFVVEVAVVVVAAFVWLRDQRKDAPRVRSWMIADGMRKLRERAEAADVTHVDSEPRGYRNAALPTIVETRTGFLAKMRARRRAKQMLEIERGAR